MDAFAQRTGCQGSFEHWAQFLGLLWVLCQDFIQTSSELELLQTIFEEGFNRIT
jgi:hypothetical protein